MRHRAGAAGLRGPRGTVDRDRARAGQGHGRRAHRLPAAQPRRPRRVRRRLRRVGRGHGQRRHHPAVRPRRFRPARRAALQPRRVRRRSRPGRAHRLRPRLLHRRGDPGGHGPLRRARRRVRAEHGRAARPRRHGQRGTRPRRAARGARRRDAHLPGLLLRHRARRHLRVALPRQGRPPRPRRSTPARPDVHRGVRGPGGRLRERPARLHHRLPGRRAAARSTGRSRTGSRRSASCSSGRRPTPCPPAPTAP